MSVECDPNAICDTYPVYPISFMPVDVQTRCNQRGNVSLLAGGELHQLTLPAPSPTRPGTSQQDNIVPCIPETHRAFSRLR